MKKDSNSTMTEEDLKDQKVRLYKIKHFIFDFGGVLIERTFVLKNLLAIMEIDLSISIPDKDIDPYIRKIRRRLSSGLISAREFLEIILDKYYYPYQVTGGSLPPKKVNVEYYLELWFNLYSQVTQISSDMAEIIERLHKAGYVVSLMSNTYDIHAKSNELKGFYDMFDHVFLSNEIGLIKPDMDKYKHVLNKLDTKPKKCIFIDDKIRNLFPAQKLGIIVLRFQSFNAFKEKLNELGIEELTPNLRKDILKQYERYKTKKKEYKKVKKEYKKAKKEYMKKLQNKKKSEKRRLEYQKKRGIYRKVKEEFALEKKMKKELISKIDAD